MHGVRLRLAEERDAGAIAGVLADAVLHTRAHFGTEPPTDRDVRTQWSSSRAIHPWIVAEEDSGVFLGFAKAGTWIPRGGYDRTVETSVYLTRDARGRGVGRYLYMCLFEVLRAQGYVVAVAGVAAGNPASEKLHESVGMRAIGSFDPIGYKLGAWTAVIYYHLVLRPEALDSPPGELVPVERAWASKSR